MVEPKSAWYRPIPKPDKTTETTAPAGSRQTRYDWDDFLEESAEQSPENPLGVLTGEPLNPSQEPQPWESSLTFGEGRWAGKFGLDRYVNSLTDSVNAIIENVEILAGVRGDEDTNLLTQGDLVTLVADPESVINIPQGDVYYGPSPPPPTNLHVVLYDDNNNLSSPWYHHLEWNNPENLTNVYYIEVWSSTVDNISTATRVGIVTPPNNSIMIYGANMSADYYFWVRSMSYGNQHSTWEPSPDQGGYLVEGYDSVNTMIDNIMNILKGENPPDWDSGLTYYVGDMVTLTSGSPEVTRKFKCILEHTNQTPPNITYWERIGILMEGEVGGEAVVGIDGNLVVDGTILADTIGINEVNSTHINTNTILISNLNSETTNLMFTTTGRPYSDLTGVPDNVTLPPDENLVGYWSLDAQGALAIDNTGNSNHGVLDGCTWVTGMSGYALEFDYTADDHVDVPDFAGLDFGTGDYSISCWAKINTFADQGSSVNVILARGTISSTPGCQYGLHFSSTGHPRFSSGDADEYAIYTTDMTDGEWHHIVGVRESGVLSIYVDSTKGTDGNFSALNVDGAQPLKFGGDGFTTRYLDGSLDEIRIYDKAITVAEITGLYGYPAGNKPFQIKSAFPSDEDLAAYWSFDDGAGTVAIDNTGNGNDGTLINTPTWVAGVSGRCLDFEADSNEYVDIPDSIITLDNDFSLSFWINPEDDAVNNRWISMIDASDNFQIGQTSTEAIWVNMDSTAYTTAASIITYGTWHHIVIVKNSGVWTLYVDGVEVSIPAAGSYTDASISAIGGGIINNHCDGKMDEVRLYEAVLTQAEIDALERYPAGTGPTVFSGAQTPWSTIAAGVTYIDGGHIYVGSDISIGSAAWGDEGIQLHDDSGDPKFYCGDGSTEFFSYDSIYGVLLSTSSGLTILSGGSITVESGGDIILKADLTNPSRVYFEGTSYSTWIGAHIADGSNMNWNPVTDDSVLLLLGGAGKRFSSIQLYSSGGCTMYSLYALSPAYNSSITVDSGADNGRCLFTTTVNGTGKSLSFYQSASALYFSPSTDSEIDLGRDLYRWSTVFCDSLSVQGYDTGWINRSDWTDVHLGSDDTKDTDSGLDHNLNAPLSELVINVMISTDGTDDNSFIIQTAGDWGTGYNLGITIYQVDDDQLIVQTGGHGLQYITDVSGTRTILNTQDWYYKVRVFKIGG